MSHATLSIGIHGATGRMGTRLIQFIPDDPALTLGAAGTSRTPQPGVTRTARRPVAVWGSRSARRCRPIRRRMSSSPSRSRPRACSIAEVCADEGTPLVVGTTGFEPDQKAELLIRRPPIPLLVAPNIAGPSIS